MARPTLADRKYLRVPQVARALHMSDDTVRRHIRAGILPSPTHVRAGGTMLFSFQWLERAREAELRLQDSRLQAHFKAEGITA